MCSLITIDTSSSSCIIVCMISIQLFTVQILNLISKPGHAYLSPRISLIQNSCRVMHNCIYFKKGIYLQEFSVMKYADWQMVSLILIGINCAIALAWNHPQTQISLYFFQYNFPNKAFKNLYFFRFEPTKPIFFPIRTY